ncbi:MAG: glycosyltransferase family 2 protein [Methylotenera sp.]|nr:glycosyltransferase family 2 protein [Oligoflexia bacterium]
MIDLFTPLKSSRLSVIVPVFNEAQNILKNLDLLISEIEPYFLTYEILVVSDGSTDGTHQVLQRFEHPNVRTIAFTRNKGKGHAVREGFKEAQGDYILFIDGGMELHPRDIRVFLGLMELYRADIVIGSKRHPQSQVEYPVLRRILSSIYQLLIRKVFDLNVTDTQVGLKLFRKSVIDAILPELTIDRYGFDLEILALARSKGFRLVLEAPIRLEYFNHNTRSPLLELVHVFKVGSIILMDTYRLARRLRVPVKAQITSQGRGSGNSP